MGRQIYGDTDGVRLIGTDPCLCQLSSIVMAVNFPGRGARGSPFLQSFHLQVVGKLWEGVFLHLLILIYLQLKGIRMPVWHVW